MGRKLRVTWDLELGQLSNEKPRYGQFAVATHLEFGSRQNLLSTIPVNSHCAKGAYMPRSSNSAQEMALRATEKESGADQWLI